VGEARVELGPVVAARVPDDAVVVAGRIGEEIEIGGRELVRRVALADLPRASGVARPTKLLREAIAPLIAVLPGLMVSLLPLPLTPGVAATATSASNWNTAWTPSSRSW